MKRIAILAAALALATPAAAQDSFDAENEATTVCAGCHGENGIPDDPEIPIIWGQEYFYLYTQLKDYAADRRSNEIMTPMASNYSRDQIKALAQYFAEKEWPRIEAHAEPGDEQIVQRAESTGQCSACHGKWDGNSNVPRLAGQQPGYLKKTMMDFKNEVRLNAPDKIATMQNLEDSQIEALARYLPTVQVIPR